MRVETHHPQPMKMDIILPPELSKTGQITQHNWIFHFMIFFVIYNDFFKTASGLFVLF
jgi:hypothetical protein